MNKSWYFACTHLWLFIFMTVSLITVFLPQSFKLLLSDGGSGSIITGVTAFVVQADPFEWIMNTLFMFLLMLASVDIMKNSCPGPIFAVGGIIANWLIAYQFMLNGKTLHLVGSSGGVATLIGYTSVLFIASVMKKPRPEHTLLLFALLIASYILYLNTAMLLSGEAIGFTVHLYGYMIGIVLAIVILIVHPFLKRFKHKSYIKI